ncbi:MAG: T9SS type A sorting domain-containing protein [Lewinella sp.]
MNPITVNTSIYTFSGLTSGSYSATITDSRNCTTDVAFIIEADPNCGNGGNCSATLITENVICFGSDDGFITADPFGTAPFTYLWSNGATTQNIEGLAAGFYSLTLTDADGCVSVQGINIGSSSRIRLSLQEIGGSCDANDTLHFLNPLVFGGVEPYAFTYSVDGVPVSTEEHFDNPIPGVTYTLTVTDALGCTEEISWTALGGSGSFTINWFSPFFLPCDGGSVEIATGDSTDLYEYQWITPNNDTLGGPSIQATEVGIYSLLGVSTDGNCTVTGEALVVSSLLGDDYSIEMIDSMECGFERCMYVLSENPNVWRPGIIFIWTAPDGSVTISEQGGWICVEDPGLYTLQVASQCDTVTLTTILEDNPECASLNGTIYIDADANCGLDAGDVPAAGVIVEITGVDNGALYYDITDADGRYGTEVVVGTYTVRPISQPTQPFGTCEPPATATVTADSPTELDAFLPALMDCPLLTTEITMPFLRRCFQGGAYVTYENLGSATAEDAQLVVTLDDFLIDVVSNITPASQDGNTFTFDLGDLPPFADGRIWFNFTISCDAELGQIHCIEAAITPDEVCNGPEDWNGAMVNVSTPDCRGEMVTFDISNVGENLMSVPLSYVVVEDGIMMTPVPVIVQALTPGEVFTVSLPANGQTYQVVTNQEPNAPASDTPTAMAEGCVVPADGNFSTGFGNMLALGNGVPAQAIVCRENVGAYDPNDKLGYPLGHGAEDNIPLGTRLDYTIRFQNTGTDTAFNVVIKDTISMALDLASFKEGSFSHPYTIDIDSHRVLTFTFANIMLPDSNVNLAASQGAVSFSIDHAADLARGDDIFNSAAIYFDFNEPIITNNSHHRIEKQGLPTSLRSLRAQEVSLGVYPNPGNGLLNISVPNRDIKLTDMLTVTDLYGRQLATTVYGQLGGAWDVRHLKPGFYLLVVTDENGLARGRTGFVVNK